MINFQKWYCPNCGIVESKGDYREDMFNCSGCDRPRFKRTPPPFLTAMTARIAHLEALIADAPHSDSCCLEYVTVGSVDRDKTRPYCNCWKSKAEPTGAQE